MKSPPRFARLCLKLLVRDYEHEALIGDFDELYKNYAHDFGLLRANLWYWGQICLAVPAIIRNSVFWSVFMFKNYLKTALRNINRYKGYSFINIAGLAIGMACCILLFSFVRSEINYDRFHKNIKDIYRVLFTLKDDIQTVQMAPLGPALAAEFPDITMTVRLWQGNSVVRRGEELFSEQILYADPDFLKMFTFSLLIGSSEQALSDSHSVVISKEAAVKYFGNKDPLGAQLSIKLGGRFHEFKVTGITREFPKNSSIGFEFLLPLPDRDWSGNLFSWRHDHVRCGRAFHQLPGNKIRPNESGGIHSLRVRLESKVI